MLCVPDMCTSSPAGYTGVGGPAAPISARTISRGKGEAPAGQTCIEEGSGPIAPTGEEKGSYNKVSSNDVGPGDVGLGSKRNIIISCVALCVCSLLGTGVWKMSHSGSQVATLVSAGGEDGVEAGASGEAVALEASYVAHKSLNCPPGPGSVPIDNDATAPMGYTTEECQDYCSSEESCDCVVRDVNNGECWRRGKCELSSSCSPNPAYDVFVKVASPTV